MLLKKEREEIIRSCLSLIKTGLTNGTSGNVSIYNRRENLIALTPSGIDYNEMKAEDVSILDIEGRLIEGKKPSSELDMHMIFYKNKNDVNAVVHTHPVYITVLACLRENLPAVDYMIAVSGDKEVRCAEYASFGTRKLAKNAYTTMGKSKAVILANHGLTVVGNNLRNAVYVSEQLEYVARLYIEARKIGKPVILDKEEMEKMVERFKSYGHK